MLSEIFHQPITACVVHEAWAQPLQVAHSAAVVRPAVFGAITFELANGLCLVLYSRIRFGGLQASSHGQSQLMLSVLDKSSWHLLTTPWLERARSWRAHLPRMQYLSSVPCLGGLTLNLNGAGAQIANIQSHGNTVFIQMTGLSQPLRFDYRKDHDCAIGLNTQDVPVLQQIEAFSPEHEYAWLHPLTEMPVHCEEFVLKSPRFERWPLSLRRRAGMTHTQINGRYILTTQAVLSTPVYRDIYLEQLRRLMVQRFRQYPWLRPRLENMDLCRVNDPLFRDVLRTTSGLHGLGFF